MSFEQYIEVIGWVGTALVIGAYFLLVALKKETKDSLSYQVMNLVGALFLGVNLFWQHSWPAFTLQAIWASIAIVSLVRRGSPPRQP